MVWRLRTALSGRYLSDVDVDYRDLCTRRGDGLLTPSDNTIRAELTMLRRACTAFCATNNLQFPPRINVPARVFSASRRPTRG